MRGFHHTGGDVMLVGVESGGSPNLGHLIRVVVGGQVSFFFFASALE